MVYIENAAYYAGTKPPASRLVTYQLLLPLFESCRSDLCQQSYYLDITYWDLHKMRTDEFFLITTLPLLV